MGRLWPVTLETVKIGQMRAPLTWPAAAAACARAWLLFVGDVGDALAVPAAAAVAADDPDDDEDEVMDNGFPRYRAQSTAC